MRCKYECSKGPLLAASGRSWPHALFSSSVVGYALLRDIIGGHHTTYYQHSENPSLGHTQPPRNRCDPLIPPSKRDLISSCPRLGHPWSTPHLGARLLRATLISTQTWTSQRCALIFQVCSRGSSRKKMRTTSIRWGGYGERTPKGQHGYLLGFLIGQDRTGTQVSRYRLTEQTRGLSEAMRRTS